MNNQRLTHAAKGKYAEHLAQQLVIAQGFELVAANFYCRHGEIDFIAEKRPSLIFVEVRFRKHKRWGNATQSISKNKQQKLRLTADYFLTLHQRYTQYHCRFDVIAFQEKIDRQQAIWIPNAFS